MYLICLFIVHRHYFASYFFQFKKQFLLIQALYSDKIKNTKIGFGKPIYFPKSKDFIYVDTSDLLICQQEESKILQQIDTSHPT